MRRKYDEEFKRNEVEKVFDGQSAVSVASELGVGENLVYRWKKDFLEKGDGKKSSAEIKETAELKKRVSELKMELEIVKKAALIFGKEKG